MKKTACLKVQKECSARPSKTGKRLTSDDWMWGNNDHETTFTTFRMSTTYHHTYLPCLLLSPHVAHWLAGTGDMFHQLHSVAFGTGVAEPLITWGCIVNSSQVR